MNWNRKVLTMVLLVATLLTAGVAAMPATLSSPTLPTVIATANPGELMITWDAVPEAQHYTVGYANLDELEQMTEAGRSALDAFYYVTIGATHITHTLSRLGPEIDYYVLVGAQTKRFGADDLVWGPWSSAVKTAEASCPTTETTIQQCVSNGTCLPIQNTGTFTGTGDSAGDIINLAAGVYRFTNSRQNTDGNFFVKVVELASGDNRSVGIYVRGTGRGVETLTIYDDDSDFRLQAGNYVLEVDTDSDWEVTVDLLAAH